MFDCPLAPVRPALVDWITDMACTHAVTLNIDRELSEARLRQIYSTFCLNLDRKILGRRSVTKMNAALRLRGFAFPENLMTNAHLHCALDLTALATKVGCEDQLAFAILSTWHQATRGAGTVFVRPINNPTAWAKYISKFADRRDPKYFLTEDFHRA